MRRHLGSMFLRGAAAITVTMLAALPLVAQKKTAATGVPQFPLEVAVMYNATRGQSISSTSFWMQGAGLQIEGRMTPNFGVMADVTGSQIGDIGSTGVGLDLVTATFGPRLTWSPGRNKFAVYGHALAGEGIGFNGVFPGAGGASSTSFNLALKMGGGMNVTLSPHVALRAFEADWVRTELPNTGSNVQNNLTLGAGIVIRIR